MIITNRKHSYFVNDLSTVEIGSSVLDLKNNKMYMLLDLMSPVKSTEELINAISTGGRINITQDIDAPTGFAVNTDTVITNNNVISISEDTEGNGVFTVTDGTLTLEGKGTINGLGKNDWSMAVWVKENGKVIINDGYFTNIGAESVEDSEHFDLIYASGNGQVEINGGEFKCETPKWTLNIKDKDRATASIIVKGGKFHGFNPSNCETEGANTNFVASGYKVIEESDGIFVVVPE